MVMIQLTGRVTSGGQLEFEAPHDLPQGEARITIEILTTDDSDNEPFTQEEIEDFLTFTPRSGAEVVRDGLIGGWEDMGITDSVEWVTEQRRKQYSTKNNTGRRVASAALHEMFSLGSS
jgi:hypothetical protein